MSTQDATRSGHRVLLGGVALVESPRWHDDRLCRTLFILAARWLGFDKVDEALAARSGQVLAVRAPATGLAVTAIGP